MIKVICDRCQRQIGRGRKVWHIAIHSSEGRGVSVMEDDRYEGMHFCAECIEEIAKYIEAAPEEKAPAKGPKAEEGTKTRKRIDYGKIMALKKAGWDNGKIADEMGMTKAAVATAISTHKRREREQGERALGEVSEDDMP